MGLLSHVLARAKGHRELAAEVKSFRRIHKALVGVEIRLEPGIQGPEVVDLLLDVKEEADKRRRYFMMDRIVEHTHPGECGSSITDLVERISEALFILRREDRDGRVMLIPSRCTGLKELIGEVRSQRELYEKSVEKLKELKENRIIIAL